MLSAGGRLWRRNVSPYRYCAWAVLCLHSLDISGSLSSSSFNTIEPKWLKFISIQLTIRLYIGTRVYNFATLVIYTLKLGTKANVYHVPDLQSPVSFPNYHAGKKIISQPEYQWTMSSHILTGRPKWYLHTPPSDYRMHKVMIPQRRKLPFRIWSRLFT